MTFFILNNNRCAKFKISFSTKDTSPTTISELDMTQVKFSERKLFSYLPALSQRIFKKRYKNKEITEIQKKELLNLLTKLCLYDKYKVLSDNDAIFDISKKRKVSKTDSDFDQKFKHKCSSLIAKHLSEKLNIQLVDILFEEVSSVEKKKKTVAA